MSHFLFFFNDPAPTEIYTLSLHDALPIFGERVLGQHARGPAGPGVGRERALGADATMRVDFTRREARAVEDRKSTRLNSSHVKISYAVFCLKKKKKKKTDNKNQSTYTRQK